jgi:hypothetical protein
LKWPDLDTAKKMVEQFVPSASTLLGRIRLIDSLQARLESALGERDRMDAEIAALIIHLDELEKERNRMDEGRSEHDSDNDDELIQATADKIQRTEEELMDDDDDDDEASDEQDIDYGKGKGRA